MSRAFANVAEDLVPVPEPRLEVPQRHLPLAAHPGDRLLHGLDRLFGLALEDLLLGPGQSLV
jgi:hypothetical protein